MLAVLEQAQAAGQKAQQGAQIGQGSIFDLADGGDLAQPAAGAPAQPNVAVANLPIPAGEFDQAQLLAVEKEAIGLFISAHPLKPVREALRARVDCPLAALAQRRDKDWVTVGGIVTEAKRIRTRNGDHMLFATLDDLEGSVELLVFGKALAEHEAVLRCDQVALVRGRVDHKEAGKTCLVVQSAETFQPTEEEIELAGAESAARAAGAEGAGPMRLRVDPARLPPGVIDDLKHLFESFPGPTEVVLEMDTAAGPRRLRLGEAYRVAPSPSLHAELEHLLAPARLAAA
jgi:DNA polymerase-3 subunit alpha